MNSYDIVFSGNNGEEIYYLPVIPNPLPEVTNTYYSEDFESLNGTITLLGERELREFTISSVLPFGKRRYSRPNSIENPWDYISFFNKYAQNKLPIRMIILEGVKEISNLAYSVVSITTSVNNYNEIAYTLTLKEYQFLNVG